MPTMSSERGELTATDLRELVATALAQDSRTGLSEMLSVIARSVEAQACILWQEAPFTQTSDDPSSGELFVLADWVESDRRSALYRLSLGNSATGMAILQNRPIPIEDILTDNRVDRADPFLPDLGVRSFCAVPIRFLDGKLGAVNVYRTRIQSFNDSEVDDLRSLIELLPQLYQTISDKVSYELVKRVNQILQDTQATSFTPTARDICRIIAKSFNTVETSLFLNNLNEPEVYNMVATTWPSREELPKTSYLASKNEGLTGWVLEEQSPVAIFDLKNFEDDHQQIKKRYPGIIWGDGLNLKRRFDYQVDAKEKLKAQLKRNDKQRDQPFSFMAVPVMAQHRLTGALRCCTVKEGPFYFSDREIRLLHLVADQVGQAWASWLQADTMTKLRQMSKTQVQIFQDFAHQLRSPINQVHARSKHCIEMASGRLEKHLVYLRGLSSKAKRATQSLGLFARLAEDRELKINRKRLYKHSLIRTLVEIKYDQLAVMDPDRRLEIIVEESGFDVLQTHIVKLDHDLLWHAVNNLVDNAVKYSFNGSTIRIFGGLNRTDRFHITVVNRGIRLEAPDVRRCIKRSWRSKTATRVVGEGSGIGLWIVDHIMRAHKGRLLLLPTTADG